MMAYTGEPSSRPPMPGMYGHYPQQEDKIQVRIRGKNNYI